MDIKVDDKFKNLFSELNATEYKILKAGIKEKGGNKDEPISVWEETGIIYDGHHRYKVCIELGLEPTYIFKSFPSRNHVLLEIYHTQLGRRNVTPEVYAIYLLEMNAIQIRMGGDPVTLPTSKIAEESHLSESSVTKLKRIKEVNPRAIKKIKADESTIQKEYEKIGGRPAHPKKKEPRSKEIKGAVGVELNTPASVAAEGGASPSRPTSTPEGLEKCKHCGGTGWCKKAAHISTPDYWQCGECNRKVFTNRENLDKCPGCGAKVNP